MRLSLFVLAAALVALPVAAAAAPEIGVPVPMAGEILTDRVVTQLQARRLLPADAAADEEAIRRSLVDLQQAKGLAPTGWIDRDTLDALGLQAVGGRGLDTDDDDEGIDLPGTPGFQQHEAARLAAAAATLERQAQRIAAPRARELLQDQAAKAREVARLYRAQAQIATPTAPVPAQPRGKPAPPAG
ncbi:hypothetical protein [Vulgatibacter sp.]|uniref:hypothetical protein n=1 Tax=Vulgatibacter sp. TaxID=1971226 RepID=UPI003563A569